MKEFKTTHNLAFEIGQWPFGEFARFRIGTCYGLWRSTESSYDILAIDNNEPGNGHLEDVFEWFLNSCLRDRKNLKILELWNERFKKHLIEKRSFISIPGDHVELPYKKIKKGGGIKTRGGNPNCSQTY